MNRILLDTNVILDLILAREPFYESTVRLFKLLLSSDNYKGYITANSITDIFYITKKSIHYEKVRLMLIELLKYIEIVNVCKTDIKKVLLSDYPDLEDALQIVCAEKIKAYAIITRDKKMKATKIKILTPTEFLGKYILPDQEI